LTREFECERFTRRLLAGKLSAQLFRFNPRIQLFRAETLHLCPRTAESHGLARRNADQYDTQRHKQPLHRRPLEAAHLSHPSTRYTVRRLSPIFLDHQCVTLDVSQSLSS
jgi:hypothetical protein